MNRNRDSTFRYRMNYVRREGDSNYGVGDQPRDGIDFVRVVTYVVAAAMVVAFVVWMMYIMYSVSQLAQYTYECRPGEYYVQYQDASMCVPEGVELRPADRVKS